MSNLDIYCVSHFDEKQLFAHMGELGLSLDPKDFATNGYQVDERQHPRTAPKASGRKGKAVVPSKDESEEDEEQEEEDLAGAGASQGASADNATSVSDDDEDTPSREEELPLSGAQLTSPIADVEALVRRRNIIAPRTLFVEEAIIEAAEPPPSGPAVETRLAKKARQSRAGFVPAPSSSSAGEDMQSSRIHHLEGRLDKMNQSNLETLAQLQQTMADQAWEQNKMMLNQQQFNKQLVDSQNNFMKSTCKSLQSILVSLPTMMRQYAIEAQALNPAPLSTISPQLMLTMANSAPAPSGDVLSPTPSAVAAST